MDFQATLDKELDRLASSAADGMDVDGPQLDAWKNIVLQDLRPVRPVLPTIVFALAFGLAFAALALLSILVLRSYGWHVLMPAQKVIVFASLSAAAALLAITLSREMIPGTKVLFHPGLVIVSLFVCLTLIVASVFQIRAEKNFLHDGAICLQIGVPFAIPAALIFGWILRKGTVLSRRWTAAVTGMLAGLVSTSALEIHCPILNMWHILLFHFGIPLLGVGAGFLFALASERLHRKPLKS